MRENDIKAKRVKKVRLTTTSRPSLPEAEKVLERNFSVACPDGSFGPWQSIGKRRLHGEAGGVFRLPERDPQDHLHDECYRIRKRRVEAIDQESLIYLALQNISRKWTMPVKDWRAALNQFANLFEGRLPLV